MAQSIYDGAPNLVSVCIDRKTENDISGRMCHFYCREPIPFRSAGELLIQMDQFFDALNFPQAAMAGRHFRPSRTSQINRETDKCQRVEDMEQYKGEIATFVVHVQYRQNATWQGKVIWANEQRECNFRSALELIKLMDNAMDASVSKQSEETKDD